MNVLYDVPTREQASHLLVIRGSMRIEHAGDIKVLSAFKLRYDERCIKSCIFKNNLKGIEAARKYAFVE